MPYYDKFVRMVNGGDLESDKNLDYYKEQSAAADSSGQQSGDSFLPNLTSWANAAANFIAPGRAEALAQYPTYNGGYVKPWDVWGETTQQRFKKNAQEYPHGTAFGMGFAEGAANAWALHFRSLGLTAYKTQ